MLRDGIYGLAYAAGGERMPTEGSALATLRDGRILGSDPWGAVFSGSCRFDAEETPQHGVSSASRCHPMAG